MSEQLIQLGLEENGIKFGKYEYYAIGNVTFKELKKYKIIPNIDYREFENKKPDNLLVDRRNKKNISVQVVVEHKSPEQFNTEKKKEDACKQCNTYCQLLSSKIGIVTDGTEYIWINPRIQLKKAEVTYKDSEIFNNVKEDNNRGFSYIKREDGYILTSDFNLNSSKDVSLINNTFNLLERVISEIDSENSQMKKEKYIDASNLAHSVWQDVWISKSATPEKALSTFIEIFMFKYLSDLGVLTNNAGLEINFDYVYKLPNSKNDKGEQLRGKDYCLKYYYDHVRPYIKNTLFPKNEKDGTTLINGMSLNADVKEDNHIFYNILKKFNSFGSLKNINLEFKSRLFEDFLKKSISKKNWGQFFTPRNVVKAIIEMSGIEKLPQGAKVCDPACGVGGFLLEPLITKRTNDFYFENDKLKCKLIYKGYEKGFTKDEKLTTVLAKANFVIYLSELLKENPTLTTEFARNFNSIFKVYTDTILGSLSENKPEEYDLIMSNPPYVINGTGNFKNAIKDNLELKKFFKENGTGLEGLFLEKIIRELKKNGKALIIIPDGILNRISDKKIRNFIKRECIIDAIISLPKNTFYTTPKKTYILVITKKEDSTKEQIEPVFTYLVNFIGETLDTNRFPEEDKNDLKDMVKQFKYFETDKNEYEPFNNKCKVQPIEKFDANLHWSVDRWWSKDEKIELGVEEEEVVLSEQEFNEKLKTIYNQIGSWLELDKE